MFSKIAQTKLVVLVATTFLFVGSLSHAQADPLTLKQNMEGLGQEMKAISKVKDDPSQNPASLASAKKIIGYLIDSEVLVPAKVAGLADPEAQKVALADYQKAIAQMTALAGSLKEDFLLNDNKAANATLTEMVALMKQAHQIFK